MNARNIKFAGALLIGLFMVSAMNAQPRQSAWLDLSEEQQEELSTLRTEHFKEITPLRNKMAELKARERTLLSEENVDMKALEANIDEQTDLMNSIKKLQTKHQLAVKNVLSDEQFMKLQQRRGYARGYGSYGKGMYRGERGQRMGRGYQRNQNYRMDRYDQRYRDRRWNQDVQMEQGVQMEQSSVTYQKI